MASAAIWNPRNLEHLAHFSTLLKPFQRASGTRLFDDQVVATEVVQAWVMSLSDVPADVLEEACARLFREGVTWMPRPGDVRRHCVAIVKERRRALAARAKAITDECEDCHGSLFVEITDAEGVIRMARCGCHRRGLELLSQAPAALPEPRERDEEGAA